MKVPLSLPFFVAVLALSPAAFAGGLASSEHLIVQAPSQSLASEVLRQATHMQGGILADWLAGERPRGSQKLLINVSIAEASRSGHFTPAGEGKLHSLYLSGTTDELTGPWLKTMLTHATLAAAHGANLPPWATAGAAAQAGDAAFAAERARLLQWFANTNRWPDLESLLNENHLDESDRAGVAAAGSLAEFLLTRGDRPALLRFAVNGSKTDWSTALAKAYGIRDGNELQRQWQAWATTELAKRPSPQHEAVARPYAVPQHNAAVASDANFTIYADDRQMCLDVLASANALRERIAREWLGQPLPAGVGHTIVRVVLTPDKDRAKTLPQNPASRTSHMVWISTSPDQFEYALAHEITHTIFATRFADELPVWAHEGAASQQDDPQLHAQREATLRELAFTGSWPRLERLFAAPELPHTDAQSYAVAASLTDYLVAQGGKAKLLQFAVDGQRGGYDAALRKHYGIDDVVALNRAWQRYAAEQTAQRSGPMSPVGSRR